MLFGNDYSAEREGEIMLQNRSWLSWVPEAM